MNRVLVLAATVTLLAWNGPGCNPKVDPVTPPAPTVTPPPSPAPHVDAGPQDSYAAACAHLEALGCHQLPTCAQAMRRADADHLTIVPTACIMTATSREGALGCTFVRCQP